MSRLCMQVRLTGDPYIAHCVEAAAIVERLHASPKDLDALDEVDERCAACSGKPRACEMPHMRARDRVSAC